MRGFLAAVEARVLAEHGARIVETPYKQLPETPYKQLPALASGARARAGKLRGVTERQMAREEVLARGRRVVELREMGERFGDICSALGCTERQCRHAESVYRESLRDER